MVRWLKRRVDVLFSVSVENKESDVLLDAGRRVSPSGGGNWELMATTLFVKKLVQSSAVRDVNGGGGIVNLSSLQ